MTRLLSMDGKWLSDLLDIEVIIVEAVSLLYYILSFWYLQKLAYLIKKHFLATLNLFTCTCTYRFLDN